MRSREEIWEERNDSVVAGYATESVQDLTLEVLLDLRDLLQPISEAALASKQMQELVLEKMRNDPPFPKE